MKGYTTSNILSRNNSRMKKNSIYYITHHLCNQQYFINNFRTSHKDFNKCKNPERKFRSRELSISINNFTDRGIMHKAGKV